MSKPVYAATEKSPENAKDEELKNGHATLFAQKIQNRKLAWAESQRILTYFVMELYFSLVWTGLITTKQVNLMFISMYSNRRSAVQ